MIKVLNWRTLEQRRIDSRPTVMYKITYVLVAIPAADYQIPNTRQSRHNHQLAYRQIPTLKDYYKFTFFPRTIVHWNALPFYIPVLPTVAQFSHTGCGSSIGSEFAWYASGPEFDPHVRHILSWRLGHENISTAILPLPLIQESSCQLLAKECALSTGKLPRRLAQEQYG